MQQRLVLIRHARTEDHHRLGDHARALVDEGRADARALGVWLAAQGLGPDHVLVSTAVRAQQTLAELLAGAGVEVAEESVWPERRLYDGGVDGVLAAVAEAPEEAQVLWVVAHEPVMSTTTWQLVDSGGGSGSTSEIRGFPTATAGVLAPHEAWADLAPGTTRLVTVHTARADAT